MSKTILAKLTDEIKTQYDFIPYANWDNSEKGDRPVPYSAGQRYEDNHPLWLRANDDRIGIRLNNLVLVDYDGNKPEAVGEIPSTSELAIALGYSTSQELFDSALIQWNPELTSLHFLFLAPPEFNTTDFKQSNAGTDEFFWKHIDIKTGNQLVYLKTSKQHRLFNPTTYRPAPPAVIDQLRDKSEKTLAVDFDYNHTASEHQQEQAQEWLHESTAELANTESGSRNATLNMLACTAAGLVAGGALDNQASYTLLFEAALDAGLDRSEVIATLNSGWHEGFSTPRRDAPYRKSCMTPGEVFNDHLVNDTNIDVLNDSAITELIQQGHIDPTDPNIGILHNQYKYFMNNWVMNKEGRFIDTRNLADYSKTAFDAMHNDSMPVRPGSKAFKRFRASEVFESANPKVISDIMYRPGSDKLFSYESVDYLNSYIEYVPDRPPEAEIRRMYALIIRHLQWLFTDPGHQRFVLDWLAWQVQNTGQLVGWVPLIIGCRGDGKSVLFELVTSAVGSRNTKLMSNNSINSTFQNWAIGSATTAFEEIKIDSKDSRRIANDMKPFITEPRVTVNCKNKPEMTVPNNTNYIAFSNEPDPIAISSGDRRWMVLHTVHFGMNSVSERTQTDMKQHFDDIKDAVNYAEHHPAIHWVLREHEISDVFLNHRFRAPQTVFSSDLIEQTASERENRLQEYLDNACFVDGRQGRIIDHEYGFQIQDFRPVMPENWFSGMDKKPSAIVLGKWLRHLGYELAVRIGPDGTKIKTFKRG